jgi:5-methylcytosine-specific restriction endonuclease McrA
MSEVLNKIICLKLNANWQPVGLRSVRDAITDLTSSGKKGKPALALDVTYARNEDGTIDYETFLESPRPVSWDEWVTLPVREEDLFIQSAKGTIRVPTILVARNFAKMPMKTFKPTRKAIFERDGGICQVTGKPVGWKGGNLDHVHARSKGGRNTFENLVWMAKELNSQKANKSLDEAGLTLIRKPVAPKDVPLSHTFTRANHPSWIPFLPSLRS